MNAEAQGLHDSSAASAADWQAFTAPASAEAFVASWFRLLFADMPGARAAVLLLERRDGGFARAAVWPVPDIAADDLLALAQKGAQKPGETLVEIADDGQRAISYPVAVDGRLQALIAFRAQKLSRQDMEAALRRLYWGAGWLHSLVSRQNELDTESARQRLATVLETLAAIEDEPGLEAGLRGLVNEILIRLEADRVTFARLGSRRLKLRAVSETAEVEQRSSDMRALLQALEECRLQMRSLSFPPPPDETVTILAAHRAHARVAGTSSMISVPVLHGGRLIGVVAAERLRDSSEPEAVFRPESLLLLEAIAAAAAPVIALKMDNHRLLSGRLPAWTGMAFSRLFGRGHPAIKLAVAAFAVIVAALLLVPTRLTIGADAVVRAEVQRTLVAPMDGYIGVAPVRAGDHVVEGQELARLDDTDLQLEKLRWEGEITRLTQEARQKLAEGDRVGVALADARAASARAQRDLALGQLGRIAITAPFDGLVVNGDLTQRLGAPVSQGDQLFEVAFGDAHSVILDISEFDIGLVDAEAQGELALAGYGDPLPIRVTHIGSVSQAADGRNAFRVEAQLLDDRADLRPGLEGSAKLEVGRTSWLYALARPLWVRLRYQLWQWLP